MQSFCLVQSFKLDQQELMTNVMMKLNLKLGGVNHIVDAVKTELKADTMVLGADLIHPSPNAFPSTPSIASMVGSVDDHAGKCLGSMRLQSIDKTDREVSVYATCLLQCY
jgi:eukaryotic translation initiation factor 2C